MFLNVSILRHTLNQNGRCIFPTTSILSIICWLKIFHNVCERLFVTLNSLLFTAYLTSNLLKSSLCLHCLEYFFLIKHQKFGTAMSSSISVQICSSAIVTLAKTINHFLDGRPSDPSEIFEYSLSAYDKGKSMTIPKQSTMDSNAMNAENNLLKLFTSSTTDENGNVTLEEDFEIPVPNLQYMNYFFQKAGTGFGSEEVFRIALSLKQLALDNNVSVVRFWGKIFGIQANYLIAEVEFREGGDEQEILDDDYSREKFQSSEKIIDDYETGGDNVKEHDALPQSTWCPPPEIPMEKNQTGANKKTYFVCNTPGEMWVGLPQVTPAQIATSRHIKKLLTGKLDANIKSYPLFPGNEANYLRAIIARISASTQVSPAGYFTFPVENDEVDDAKTHQEYILNPEFLGLSLKELTDKGLSHWVHHTDYILPQGTCHWYDPNRKVEDGIEEVDGDSGAASVEDRLSENGPSLLTSLSFDKGIGTIPAWSALLSTELSTKSAIAILRSNVWPGAYAIAQNKVFENVYIGWGVKYNFKNFSPMFPDTLFKEYSNTIDLIEWDDPNVEIERELLKQMTVERKSAEERFRPESESLDK